MKNKEKLIYFIVIILASVFLFGIYDNINRKVAIEPIDLKADLARTPRERAKGLSGREGLAENEALILEFDEEDYHSIWMKDMNFSIDVIWINSQKEIVTIKSDVSPDSYPEYFSPAEPTKYVLEVEAGFAEDNNLHKGDKLHFEL